MLRKDPRNTEAPHINIQSPKKTSQHIKFSHKKKYCGIKEEKSIVIFLWNKEQRKLHLSALDQPTQDFSLVSAERDILPIKVLVASFYLSQQSTLGVLSITKQSPHAHIIGKEAEQQGILTIAFEVFKAFPKIGTKQRVCLPFRHIRSEVFAWLQLMTISNIRIIKTF